MDIECMEIVDDDDFKEVEDNPEDEIYECDFDICKVVADTLSSLDVKIQIQDAINATGNTIDVLELKQKTNADLYTGLEVQIKKLQLFIKTNIIGSPSGASCLPGASSSPGVSSSPSTPVNVNPTAKVKDKSDQSADVIPLVRIVNKPTQLPRPGELVRKKLMIGARVYAMKGSVYSLWYRGRIIGTKNVSDTEVVYKIKYDSKKTMNSVLSPKHLAYSEASEVSFPVGTRVIAQYRDEYFNQTNSMYAGVIAEPLKIMNKYRYLVFFDDGYAQYVKHRDVRLVCICSQDVWDDVHPDSKEFIKNYLLQYPERPMVKLQKGHVVKTEWNGKWWVAKVLEVDGSMVKMYFHADRRTEWIYRGSTRLGPLYSELANAEAVRQSGRGARRHNLALVKRSAPYVEYTRGFDEPTPRCDEIEEKQDSQARKQNCSNIRQVARKHTTAAVSAKRPPVSPRHVEFEGSFEPLSCESKEKRCAFREHARCNTSCLCDKDDDPILYKGKNPLNVPMLFGWERQITKYKTIGKLVVFYRAPCGRRLRTLNEIYSFLVVTKSKLTIDLFCMDTFVHCDGEFKPATVLCYIKDISYGKENVKVSGVNSFDRGYPDYVEYSTKRIPNKGVNLNLDPAFLVCCSCEDNCSDRSKCECQQLTIEATGAIHDGELDQTAGYYYRRLQEPLLTGLYECNSQCKCNYRCLNRVVQNGLSLRLQVFKTQKRGWGIRCIDDIPKGGFICTYAGQLLTEQGANEDGTQFGDEYLAELDYIEVIERQKEGYESDVVDANDDEDDDNDDGDEDNDDDDDDDDEDEDEDEEDKVPDKVKCSDKDSAKTSKKKKKKRGRTTEKRRSDNDSDYEARCVSPVAPRPHSVRQSEILTKLVLRREASDQESNQSWSVRHGHASDDPAIGESSSEKDEKSKAANSSTSGKSKGAIKPATVDKTKNIEPIIIDSESDNSMESSDRPGSHSKDFSSSSRTVSRLCPMKDATRKGSGKRSSNTGLTTEPRKRVKHQSARGYFGDEFCYIMDAKSLGNIGRYLNHSCSPNAFVQNVFVDTHDLRFPWVTFFALQYIRAGSELTWDYNYEVGSVPNKVMYCYCGSKECRGRLL